MTEKASPQIVFHQIFSLGVQIAVDDAEKQFGKDDGIQYAGGFR